MLRSNTVMLRQALMCGVTYLRSVWCRQKSKLILTDIRRHGFWKALCYFPPTVIHKEFMASISLCFLNNFLVDMLKFHQKMEQT